MSVIRRTCFAMQRHKTTVSFDMAAQMRHSFSNASKHTTHKKHIEICKYYYVAVCSNAFNSSAHIRIAMCIVFLYFIPCCFFRFFPVPLLFAFSFPFEMLKYVYFLAYHLLTSADTKIHIIYVRRTTIIK